MDKTRLVFGVVFIFGISLFVWGCGNSQENSVQDNSGVQQTRTAQAVDKDSNANAENPGVEEFQPKEYTEPRDERLGDHEEPGTVTKKALPGEAVETRADRQQQAVEKLDQIKSMENKSTYQQPILFGDLHVHSTFSADAFLFSIPAAGGQGSHPPAEACDFARYVSGLDFFSLTDHAFATTPRHWDEAVEMLRQCNRVTGQGATPDMIPFLGFEWTQVGDTPKNHWGHRNVIFHHLNEDSVPDRPIGFTSSEGLTFQTPNWYTAQPENEKRLYDFRRYQRELKETPTCPKGVDVRELPDNCQDVAPSPDVLFEKLAQWGFDSLVIPHGTTWGFYTPPGSDYAKQLTPSMHSPKRQRLVEVFSGHGNSEEYREFRSAKRDEKGNWVCPRPTSDFTPGCWRAGEIIRSRCKNPESSECQKQVALARKRYLQAGAGGHNVVPNTTPADWKDAGVCRSCYLPSFQYRPRGSVQYMLALARPDAESNMDPFRFIFGFIASSDNHHSKPGTGYKEYGRMRGMTEGNFTPHYEEEPDNQPKPAKSIPPEELTGMSPFNSFDSERQASFWLTGGLVAVHAGARSRDALWNSLQNRHVYGTSGDRILLWFNLLNGPDGSMPMGTATRMEENPRFQARAVGAFKQKPGCPEHVKKALGKDRLQQLSLGECYNPGNERHKITRIEVVRIKRQKSKNQPVGPLIQDPWKTFECEEGSVGCVAEFEDPEYSGSDREISYYVRAIQEPTPAVNADNVRCEYDDEGNCIRSNPVYGDHRTSPLDDARAPNKERAWSSPIYIRPE